MEKNLFTFSEFADCLGIARQTIYKNTKSGLIPFLNENGTNKIDINNSQVKDYIISIQEKTGQTFNPEKAQKTEKRPAKNTLKEPKQKTVKVVPEKQEDFSDVPPDILEALENGSLTVGQAMRLSKVTLGKLKDFYAARKTKIESQQKRGELIDREVVVKAFGRLHNIDQNQFLVSKTKIASRMASAFNFTDPSMNTKIEEILEEEFYKILNNIKIEIKKFFKTINCDDL